MRNSLPRLFPVVVLSTFVVVACEGASAQDAQIPSPPVAVPFLMDASTPDVSVVADASAAVSAAVPPTPTCISEDDVSFCGRLNKQCGMVTASDNCGKQRTVPGCGSCASTEICSINTCKDASIPCTPTTDAILCTTLGKKCGPISTFDNCGKLRNVIDCGACTAPAMCVANACMSPPACIPETNQNFCSRIGSNCGSATAADNCGVQRTVPSCGTLSFNGGIGLVEITGGVPAGLSPVYVEAWINPSPNGGGIVHLGNPNRIPPPNSNTGIFWFDVSTSLTLTIDGYPSEISVPSNASTFVFAGTIPTTGSFFVGKVVNDVVTRQTFGPGPGIAGSLMSGDVPASIGALFSGRMNNVRIWSRVLNDVEIVARYHSCIPAEAGLLRQWCMREGEGVFTYDTVTGVQSLLTNGASWSTGHCN